MCSSVGLSKSDANARRNKLRHGKIYNVRERAVRPQRNVNVHNRKPTRKRKPPPQRRQPRKKRKGKRDKQVFQNNVNPQLKRGTPKLPNQPKQQPKRAPQIEKQRVQQTKKMSAPLKKSDAKPPPPTRQQIP